MERLNLHQSPQEAQRWQANQAELVERIAQTIHEDGVGIRMEPVVSSTSATSEPPAAPRLTSEVAPIVESVRPKNFMT